MDHPRHRVRALGCSLLAMSMKDILPLRLFSTAGNLLYILYGLILNSPPLVAHGAIVIAIHAYHINRLVRARSASSGGG